VIIGEICKGFDNKHFLFCVEFPSHYIRVQLLRQTLYHLISNITFVLEMSRVRFQNGDRPHWLMFYILNLDAQEKYEDTNLI